MVVAGVLLALVGLTTACIPEPPPEPRPQTLVLYGDSLSVQSRAELTRRLGDLLPGWNVVLRVFGGTAQCDWHNDMVVDADAYDVEVVVIAFTGNYLTPCIRGTPDPLPPTRDRVAGYREDATWAVDFWRPRGVEVVFAVGPAPVGVYLDPEPVGGFTPDEWDSVRDAYLTVAEQPGVTVADEAPLFVDPATGVYEKVLPCLFGECAPGTEWIQARAADGVHLCVGPEGTDGCSTYSSGVVRYADPIVQAVALLLGRPVARARTLVEPTTPPPPTTTTTTTTTTTSTTSTTTTSTTTTTAPD